MFKKVKLNKFGFYELKDKPLAEQIEDYYKNLYYQENKGAYQKEYSSEEAQYFMNKLEQKYFLVEELIRDSEHEKRRFLDIGCGEGWSLDFFNNKNWDITGIDFSKYGCNLFNPKIQEYVLEGDIDTYIDEFIKENKKLIAYI